MLNIAARIVEERKRLGLIQDEMALIGEVSKTSQCNYESGKHSHSTPLKVADDNKAEYKIDQVTAKRRLYKIVDSLTEEEAEVLAEQIAKLSKVMDRE